VDCDIAVGMALTVTPPTVRELPDTAICEPSEASMLWLETEPLDGSDETNVTRYPTGFHTAYSVVSP